MKSTLRSSLLLAAVLAVNPVFGAEGKWTEGFGQGNLEYFIDKQGLRLMIGCPTEDGSADMSSSLSLSYVNNGKDVPAFTLTVGGTSFDGPFDAGSRVGANNFLALLELLRKNNAVVTVGKQKIVFQKSNAAAVLPVYGKKFPCNIG